MSQFHACGALADYYTARGLALFDSDEWRPDAHQLGARAFGSGD